MKKTTARNRIRITTASLMTFIAAMALSTAQAQTTRVWSGPINGQYNNFNNWTPTGAWSNAFN
jgi:hypothetical protein